VPSTKTDFNQLDGNRHPTLASVSRTDATVQGFFAKAKSLFGNRNKGSSQGTPADFSDQVYRGLKRSFAELLVANPDQSLYAFACRSYRRGNDREMGRYSEPSASCRSLASYGSSGLICLDTQSTPLILRLAVIFTQACNSLSSN
jgi:hypothetical protein